MHVIHNEIVEVKDGEIGGNPVSCMMSVKT